MAFSFNILSSREAKVTMHYGLPLLFLSDNPGLGAVTSQAGFLNPEKVNLILTFHANNDKMWNTCLCLSSLTLFMLYNG